MAVGERHTEPVKVPRQLSSSARAAADKISVEDLKKEDGVSHHQEVEGALSAMPKAQESCLW